MNIQERIRFRGYEIPLIGLGSTSFWNNDSGAERAMRTAVSNGWISLIDTAEMYANGQCEEAVGRAIKGVKRDNLFIVDKILPQNATKERFRGSLENSLKRLGTDHIDLYLLHWRENVNLSEMTMEMMKAKRDGLIREWGVSNFDTSDMMDLFACEHGKKCFANQVLYNICERGVEYDLITFLKNNDVLPMSYSILGSNYSNARARLEADSTIKKFCEDRNISVITLMLAFAIRNKDMPAFFSTASVDHMRDNITGLEFDIGPFMKQLDALFPPPLYKAPLAKI
jgi:diketogulonate reductase-like aldo/keto reductase